MVLAVAGSLLAVPLDFSLWVAVLFLFYVFYSFLLSIKTHTEAYAGG